MARGKKARRRSGQTQRAVSEIFHSKMSRTESGGAHLAEKLTELFGTVWFLNANAALFAGWILVNLGLVPGVKIFDPFPFNFLTMTVSLEAIFLSIVVLISQNRASKLADVREQIDLQVNVQAEKEVTKILHILDRMQHKLGLKDVHDAELAAMKRVLDLERLEEQVLEDMQKEHVGT